MKHVVTALAIAAPLAICAVASATAQAPSTDGPYKVLTRARVGGEGGTDYIFADPVGRRLYIPRGAVRAMPATDSSPERPAVAARISAFDLDQLTLVGEIPTSPNTQGQGVAVDPKSGHGFSSSRPQITMFDTKSLAVLKSIPIDSGVGPDGILFDSFNDRVYIFSHPTKDATVINSKDGTVLGRIDLGGTPEQAVADGKGTMYVVMQERPAGGVAVVDVKTMKKTAFYPFPDIGSCNGLALDAKNHLLFAACASSGNPPAQPAAPKFVVMSATDGKILATLPLAGGSDGATFNPATMEAFSTNGNGTLTVVKENSPTDFVVEENLPTMLGARTIAFDSKTNHILTMSVERGAAPPPPPGGGRGGQPPAIPGSFTILLIGK